MIDKTAQRMLKQALLDTLVDRMRLLGLESKMVEGVWLVKQGAGIGAVPVESYQLSLAVDRLVEAVGFAQRDALAERPSVK
jgi:hypothetical protein